MIQATITRASAVTFTVARSSWLDWSAGQLIFRAPRNSQYLTIIAG